LLIIVILAPIENIHKPITSNERKIHRTKAILLTVFLSIISLISYYVSELYSIIINTALLSIAISMVIEYLKKGCRENEKHKKNYS
jgi:Ca2+/Na+ antiporter